MYNKSIVAPRGSRLLGQILKTPRSFHIITRFHIFASSRFSLSIEHLCCRLQKRRPKMSDPRAPAPVQQVPIRTSAPQKAQTSSKSGTQNAAPPPTKPSPSQGHGSTASRPGAPQAREGRPSVTAPSGHSQPPSTKDRPSSSKGQPQASSAPGSSGASARGNSVPRNAKTQNEGAFRPPPPPPMFEGGRPSPKPGTFMEAVRAAIRSGQLKG